MKYLITENQMSDFFKTYIEKFKPELFNLFKFPIKRADKSIYGYEFEIDDTLILIFEYFMEPEFKRDLTDGYPKLRITSKLWNEIEGMFGPQGIESLVKWFDKQYELPPVKTYYV